MNATADELALAVELHRIGCAAGGIRGTFTDLSDGQQQAWYAIARHIRSNFTPVHDYAPIATEAHT